MTLDNITKFAEVLTKFEIHAFVLLGVGCTLTLMGHKEEGLMIIGGALGILRGNK